MEDCVLICSLFWMILFSVMVSGKRVHDFCSLLIKVWKLSGNATVVAVTINRTMNWISPCSTVNVLPLHHTVNQLIFLASYWLPENPMSWWISSDKNCGAVTTRLPLQLRIDYETQISVYMYRELGELSRTWCTAPAVSAKISSLYMYTLKRRIWQPCMWT